MLLGVISMFCFLILSYFGEKSQKCNKMEILGIIGLLRCSVGNPRRGVDLLQGVGYPHRGKAEVPKWHPSGTPRRSIAAPRRSYCSQ